MKTGDNSNISESDNSSEDTTNKECSYSGKKENISEYSNKKRVKKRRSIPYNINISIYNITNRIYNITNRIYIRKFFILILIPIGIFMIYNMINNMINKEAYMFALYTNETSKINKAFNWPSVTSWNILDISLHKQIFKPETANKPSVVVLVGMKQPVEMLYLRISNIITQFIKFNCSLFKPNVFIETDVFTGQLNKFVAEERKSGVRCIYVANIDQIPPNFGPSLHGLADEENAPYRDMIFLFSLIVPDPGIQYKSEPASLDDKETEPFVVNILREKWENEMGEERFEALINRLCVNVVGVVSQNEIN